MKFDIVNDYGSLEPAWLERLEEILPLYAEQEGLPDALVIGLTFCDDDAIRAINAEYRGIDRATDVLSFPTVNYPAGKTARGCEKRLRAEYDPELGACLLGDIVISVPRAIEQAQMYGHSLRREIGFLTVHSMLHLLGYDHEGDNLEALRMREKEELILTKLGLQRDMSFVGEEDAEN